MKILIIGLVSLTVLAGCAAIKPMTDPDPADPSTGDLTDIPAGMGVCKANKAVFVILIGSDGTPTGFACKKVGNGAGGGARTTQPRVIGDFPNDKPVNLGTVNKFYDSTDPCFVWVIGASRHHVCW